MNATGRFTTLPKTGMVLMGLLMLGNLAVSNAQEAKPVRLGAVVGLNAANLQGAGSPRQAAMRPGLKAGVEAAFPLNEGPFAVIGGLGISNKGSQVNDGIADYQVSLTYLQIPAMAEVTFGQQLEFFSRMGAYISLLQQGRREGRVFRGTNQFSGEEATATEDQVIDEGLQPFHVGIKGGFGLRFPCLNGLLGIRITMTRGLSEITKPGATTIFSEASSRSGGLYNRVGTLSLQYSLAIADL